MTSATAGLTISRASMSLQEDFRALILAQLGDEQDWQANEADSGSSSGDFFASFDPATSSWKMWPRCAIRSSRARNSSQRHWQRSLATWPLQGMMRNGQVFTPISSAIRTPGNVASLLPTSIASDSHNSSMLSRRVHDRFMRGHFIGWIGLAISLSGFEQRVCEPAVFRSLPRISYRSHRLRALGLAAMPAMARLIGHCILEVEAALSIASAPARATTRERGVQCPAGRARGESAPAVGDAGPQQQLRREWCGLCY